MGSDTASEAPSDAGPEAWTVRIGANPRHKLMRCSEARGASHEARHVSALPLAEHTPIASIVAPPSQELGEIVRAEACSGHAATATATPQRRARRHPREAPDRHEATLRRCARRDQCALGTQILDALASGEQDRATGPRRAAARGVLSAATTEKVPPRCANSRGRGLGGISSMSTQDPKGPGDSVSQRGFVCVAISSRTQVGQWHSGLCKPVLGHVVATVPPSQSWGVTSRSTRIAFTSYKRSRPGKRCAVRNG